MVNWEKIREEYMSGGGSYGDLAKKYGIAKSTLGARGKQEDWASLRRVWQAAHPAPEVRRPDRTEKLLQVTDGLLDKVDQYLQGEEVLSPSAAKTLSDVLKALKDICAVKPREEEVPSVTVTLEGGLKDYAE